MPFMQLELTNKCPHIRVYLADGGTCYYPGKWFTVDDIRSIHPTEAIELTGLGYLARFSAPGYLDATDWCFGTNRRALIADVKQFYGD